MCHGRLDHPVITDKITMAYHYAFGCCCRSRSILEEGDGTPRHVRHLPQSLVLIAAFLIGRNPLQTRNKQGRYLPASTLYFGEDWAMSEDKFCLCISYDSL